MIYNESPPLDRLEQGDVLKKTSELEQLLRTYHPYYAEHPDNRFFVVLTQSCDLVIRGSSCKARYIALAPVRPLRAVLKKEFEGKLENTGEAGAQPFSTHRVRTGFEQFLHKLFNNNEPPFFYFEVAHEREIPEEMCAILALPIALKPEHYQTLLAAKLIGITDVFQAKLGWLVGQLYSRVGTPDIEPAALAKKVKLYTEGIAVWLEDADAKNLRALVAQQKANGAIVGARELATLIRAIPKRKTVAIDSILRVAVEQALFEQGDAKAGDLRRSLEQDPAFAAVFR